MNKTQQQILLQALKQGKVNSYQATFVMGIKQAPTRIKELREKGYNIISHTKDDRSVDWELKGFNAVASLIETKPKLYPIFKGNTAVMVTEEEYHRMNQPVQESFL